MHAFAVPFLLLKRDVVVRRLAQLVERTLLGQQNLFISVLALNHQFRQQFQEMEVHWRFSNQF